MKIFAKISNYRTFKGERMKEEENKNIENLEEEKQVMDEAEKIPLDEVAETLEEKAEELEKDNEEIIENIIEEDTSNDEPEAELEDIDPHIKNLKKNDAAKMLVNKAKIIVKESENQMDECKLLLASDLEHYEKAKQELKDKGMNAAEVLLTQLGYEAEESSELDEDIVVFEPKEELAPIQIKDVSSGTFTGSILALIAGFITLVGMVYVATEKLGITLDVSKVPTAESLSPVMKWYGSLVGMPKEPLIGGGIILATVLFVTWLVYKIRVSIKANRNLAMAKAQLEHAEAYSAQKGTCKDEMDKVDAYIHDAIKTLKTFQIILREQEAKLERIYHIEEDKIESSDFHHKSNQEMKDTQELINVIKDFMSVPMSEEGKLSGKSSLFLHRAKAKVQKVLDRLY